MEYIGEHIFVGKLGHISLILSFVSAVLCSVSYAFSIRNASDTKATLQYKQIARCWYLLFFVGIMSSCASLAWMLFNHYFEYSYVWKHSNREMSDIYIYSCFWGGQQGSFLLWLFANAWVGLIFLYRIWNSNREKYLMFMYALMQCLLILCVLGVHIGAYKIGTSAFTLLRELPEYANLPFLKHNDYLQKFAQFKNGRGLNPLLQNYWMVIHPPVIFIGFSLSSIPFLYALYALWKREIYTWVNVALSWFYIAILFLGAGILLGGIWAYESLSFGGFWAWDPVENAILMPWLILVSAAHLAILVKKKKKYVFIALLTTITSYILVVYSTFLTRSGVLGDSSVHSFAGEGMLLLLLCIVLIIICVSIFLFLKYKIHRYYFLSTCTILIVLYACFSDTLFEVLNGVSVLTCIAFLVLAYLTDFNTDDQNDNTLDRSFFIFIGSLVFFLSTVQICINTSIPVINRLFNLNIDALSDADIRIDFYNTAQLPLLVVLLLVLGFTQYLKYKHNTYIHIFKRILPATCVSVFLSGVLMYIFFRTGSTIQYENVILLFACVWSIIANIDTYIFMFNMRKSTLGMTVSHVGFGLIMLGAVISFSNKHTISKNVQSNQRLEFIDKSFNNNKNIQIFRGDTTVMLPYLVSYTKKIYTDNSIQYRVDYMDTSDRSLRFSLYPSIQIDKQYGNVAIPGTKHFFDRDIFTYLKWANMKTSTYLDSTQKEHYMPPIEVDIALHKSIHIHGYKISFDSVYLLDNSIKKQSMGLLETDIVIQTMMRITKIGSKPILDTIYPSYIVRQDSILIPQVVTSNTFKNKFAITNLYPKNNQVKLTYIEPEYIVLEAVIFPGINILWVGCGLMVIGLIIYLLHKIL